jgi:hypothetical protein
MGNGLGNKQWVSGLNGRGRRAALHFIVGHFHAVPLSAKPLAIAQSMGKWLERLSDKGILVFRARRPLAGDFQQGPIIGRARWIAQGYVYQIATGPGGRSRLTFGLYAPNDVAAFEATDPPLSIPAPESFQRYRCRWGCCP